MVVAVVVVLVVVVEGAGVMLLVVSFEVEFQACVSGRDAVSVLGCIHLCCFYVFISTACADEDCCCFPYQSFFLFFFLSFTPRCDPTLHL